MGGAYIARRPVHMGCKGKYEICKSEWVLSCPGIVLKLICAILGF